MADNEVIGMVQVRWNSVVCYGQYQGARGRTKEKMNDIRKKAYTGKITEGARKRMASAVDLMIQFSRLTMKARPGGKVVPFRLGFVTLTVPGRVRRGDEVHKEFKKFLDWLRYRNCLYIWKAEYQKRGQIHYHLIVNQYIHYKDLQLGWNKIMKKAGYLDGYAKRHGHFMPNSTDVRAVQNNKALQKYLLKYLQKDEGKNPAGAIKKWWGASKTLLGSRFSFEMDRGSYLKLEGVKGAISDPDGKWKIVPGNRVDLLTKFNQRNYLKWRNERKKSNWKKQKTKRIITVIKYTKKEKGKELPKQLNLQVI